MFGPIPSFTQRNPRQIDVGGGFKSSRDIVIGIKIKTSDGREIYIRAKPYLQTFDQPSRYMFQDITNLIQKQMASMQETQTLRRPPEPQKQESSSQRASEPQRPSPPSENIPRQAKPQRPSSLSPEAPQGSNAPAGPSGDRETVQPSPPKADQKPPSSPSHPSPSSPSAAKDAPPSSSGQGLSAEKKSLMYQQVLLTSKFFSSEKREGVSLSASRIFLFVEQFKSLSQDCAKLEALIRQMAVQNKGMSPEQNKQLNSALQVFLKEFQGLQKQAQGALPQFQKISREQALPDDLKQAIAMLKERCEKSASQMQNQLDAKLTKLATEPSKPSLPLPLNKETPAKPGQKLPLEPGSSGTSATAASTEKGARPGMVFTPSLPSSEALAQGASEARSLASKPSTQPPQLIQSSSDLNLFNDKLQKRELHAPLNVSVLYPFNTKDQSPSSIEGKKRAERGQREQSSGTGGGGGAHAQEMVLISAGSSLLEGPFSNEEEIVSQIVELDAFLLAAFPVTNEQYADWLNEALVEGKIKPDEKGVIRDFHRNILCKTHWAAPSSQIEMAVSQGQLLFKPLKGTQRHPVTQVSWFGALAYCKDNSFRLPTEAEWEKAAGMVPDQLKKFRYGFGKDDIDLSWANYRDELKPYEDNRTSPVGFYNGGTVFTKGGKNYQSQHAISPFGCYDMSGNVRQWLDEEVAHQKVAKGGSYNSPPSELSVSA